MLHVRQVLSQRGDQPLVGHTHKVGLSASLYHIIELCVTQKVSDTDEMMDSTAFIVKAPQEMGLLPRAQFRVSGCLARRGDRAMQRARSSWVEVTTRNGSSLQPVLVTSSPSPFPIRGSDSKRTTSVSTGTLEEGLSDLQEVHEGISNSRENKLSLTIAQTPADRLCAAETADTRRRPRGPQRQTPPETQRNTTINHNAIKQNAIRPVNHHLADLQDLESGGYDLQRVVLQTLCDGIFQEVLIQTLLLRGNINMCG